MSRSSAPSLLFILAIASGCGPRGPVAGPAGKSAAVAPHALGPLGAGPPLARPAVPRRPLKIIAHTPAGKVALGLPPPITVTFNQPMAALGTAPPVTDPRRFPLRLAPRLPGTFRWLGGDTAEIVLRRLPLATRYVLTVPAGLRALSGAALDRSARFSFETARPRVSLIRAYPLRVTRFGRLRRDDALLVISNQRVTPAALRRQLRVSAGGAALPVTVSTSPIPRTLLVRPVKRWPLGARLLVTVRPGLRGAEGPLPSREPYRQRIQVNRPLQVTAIACDGEAARKNGPACWPMVNRHYRGLELSFSEPVCRAQLARHLAVSSVPRKTIAARLTRVGDSLAARPGCGRRWQLGHALRPRARYRVRVTAGLRDVFGSRLDKAASAAFRTRGLPAGIHLPDDIEAFRERWQPYRVQTVHVRRLDLKWHRLRGAELVRFVACLRSSSSDDGADRKPVADKPWAERCLAGAPDGRRTLRLKAAGERLQRTTLPLPRGPVALSISSPEVRGSDGKPLVFDRVATHTGIGLHARAWRAGVLTWVTSLRSGRPLGGVRLELRDAKARLLASGSSDARGLWRPSSPQLSRELSREHPSRLYLLAEGRKGDGAYLTVDTGGDDAGWYGAGWYGGDGCAPVFSRIAVDAGQSWGAPPQTVGYVATDRGIYRPGERLLVHGALRRFSGHRGRALGGRARLVLKGPADQRLAERRVKLSRFGVFSATFGLPRKGRLGRHSVELYRGDAWQGAVYLRVAHYRQPRFEIALRAPAVVHLGQRLQPQISARYLIGGPLAGARYRVTAERFRPAARQFGPAGFRVGSYRVPRAAGGRDVKHGTLGAAGAATSAPLDLGRVVGGQRRFPGVVALAAEVVSPAQRAVAARREVFVLPGARVVAHKPLAPRGQRVRFKLLVLDPRGKAVGGEVTATLQYWRHPARRPPWRKTLRVPPRGAVLSVPWRRGYGVPRGPALRLSTADAAGRVVETVTYLERPADWPRPEPPAALTVTLDRPAYLPGQTAQVTVTARRPVARAGGMLFVEREQLFQALPLRFDRRGVARVKLRVAPRHAARVSLRAVAVPRKVRTTPALLTAEAALDVKDDPWHLDVALRTTRRRYRPRDRVDVEVRVTDRLKRPRRAEVVVMAVDEAVLRLTRFTLADPYDALSYTPPAGVFAEDTRRRLARLKIAVEHLDHRHPPGGGVGCGTVGYGARGGIGAPRVMAGRALRRKPGIRPRRRFLTTVWRGRLVTDAAGRGKASFVLPDNTGRFRLMAFAVDGARSAGRGRASFDVEQPLLVLPALPRLLRVGDSGRVGVVLVNHALPAVRATIEATARGAAKLTGARRRTVQLGRGASREVRFALRATGAGAVRLRFTARAGGSADSVEQTLQVVRPTLTRAAAVAGQTSGAVRQKIAALGSALRRDVGGLRVELASTALVGVEEGIAQLVRYPYGCLEQRSSQLLALAAVAALGRRFGLSLPGGDPRRRVARAAREIVALQRGDGGFGFWPGSARSAPFASAYALLALQRARAVVPAALPSAPLARVATYLERQLKPQARRRTAARSTAFAVRSLQLLVLARQGKRVARTALAQVARRRGQPLFARALLLAALGELKRKHAKGRDAPALRRGIATLLTEVGDQLRVEGTTAHAEELLDVRYQQLWDSPTRTTAMVLSALLSARPAHPHVRRLVRWFLVGRPSARFRNTQEAAWALWALWDYAERFERDPPAFDAGVWLGGRRLLAAAFRGHSVRPRAARLAMRELLQLAGARARELVIAKRGRGELYYLARLRYAPRALPRRPVASGLRLRKQVAVLDVGGRPLRRRPRLGDVLLVTVTVETPQARRYLVVDDPLPAGIEAIDTRLATSSRSFGARHLRGTSRWDHRELRDDRVLFFRDVVPRGTLRFRYLARVVTPGTFVAPPTKAEEMYSPEVYGHTAAARVSYRP